MFGLTRSTPAMNTRSHQTRRSPMPSTSAVNQVADRNPPVEEVPEDPSSTNHDHSYGRLAFADDSQDYRIPPSGTPATVPPSPSGSASGSATSGSRLDASSRTERVSSRHSGISRASRPLGQLVRLVATHPVPPVARGDMHRRRPYARMRPWPSMNMNPWRRPPPSAVMPRTSPWKDRWRPTLH